MDKHGMGDAAPFAHKPRAGRQRNRRCGLFRVACLRLEVQTFQLADDRFGEPGMNYEEDDLSVIRPEFRAWLTNAAGEAFDRLEAIHGTGDARLAATTAFLTEIMKADVVYAAWEDPDRDTKGRELPKDNQTVLCSVLPCASREMARDMAARNAKKN
jgi:hypothetical protein